MFGSGDASTNKIIVGLAIFCGVLSLIVIGVVVIPAATMIGGWQLATAAFIATVIGSLIAYVLYITIGSLLVTLAIAAPFTYGTYHGISWLVDLLAPYVA